MLALSLLVRVTGRGGHGGCLRRSRGDIALTSVRPGHGWAPRLLIGMQCVAEIISATRLNGRPETLTALKAPEHHPNQSIFFWHFDVSPKAPKSGPV
jgi:hypothetical protein